MSDYRDNLYSPMQSQLLSIIPIITAPLSVIGSSMIIYIILSDRKRKLQRVYHRLLLAYSTIDFVFSINLALSGAVVPKGTPGVWGAIGNQATCEASGFITQFGQSSGLYAAFMCLYYMLILRYDVREETIAKRVEPFVHGLAFLFPLVFASAMLVLGMYNPTNVLIGWCFINAYPADCLRREEIECERAENYLLWLWITNAPYFVYSSTVTISCILTYLTVRKLELRSSRRWTHNNQSMEKTKETAIQAFLYIIAFTLTYCCFGLSTLFGPKPATEKHRSFYFPLALLIKIFLPLQGFWNFLIFGRPRYSALKGRNPQLNSFEILKQIIFYSNEAAQRLQKIKQREEKLKAHEAKVKARADAMANHICENEDERDEFAPASDLERTSPFGSELQLDEETGIHVPDIGNISEQVEDSVAHNIDSDEADDGERSSSSQASTTVRLSSDHGLGLIPDRATSLEKTGEQQQKASRSVSFLHHVVEPARTLLDPKDFAELYREIELEDAAELEAESQNKSVEVYRPSRKLSPAPSIEDDDERKTDKSSGEDRPSKNRPTRPSIFKKQELRDARARRSLVFLEKTVLGGADFDSDELESDSIHKSSSGTMGENSEASRKRYSIFSLARPQKAVASDTDTTAKEPSKRRRWSLF